MEVSKRRLKVSDKEAWGKLLSQLNSNKKPLGEIRDLTNNSAFYGLVLENNKEIVGFGSISFFSSSFKGLTGVIEDIIVDKGYRGQGLGKELMKSLLQEANKRHAKLITLTSNPNRKKARAIYEKIGFELYDTGFFTKKL